MDLPWDRWDVGRLPLALAARCGHLAAYELLASRGATADLDAVDRAVLAVARGESTELPEAPPPALGIPDDGHYGWILGQFAVLGQAGIVRNLLDSGLAVDTRGWSNFTPLDQAAMHGRTSVVQLLIARGANLTDCAFDDEGPTPLDCALWGLSNNRAQDGDYRGTVEALVSAGAPTRHPPNTIEHALELPHTPTPGPIDAQASGPELAGWGVVDPRLGQLILSVWPGMSRSGCHRPTPRVRVNVWSSVGRWGCRRCGCRW
ncbi:ankyrin repeat domain-containing protein [Acrocarpospora sp. B8E8]|uniref:ankyrin repeat domain-containing protein n=1 Tax=Acrocarpospora sp. B8E8 TaxID=3153572 RepID=UPI00325CB44B